MTVRRTARLATALAASMLAGAGLTGCGPSPRSTVSDDSAPSPFRGCPTVTEPSGRPTDDRLATRAAQSLESTSLPCFTGGQLVDVAKLGRPAVINVWASSCAPCRKELPELDQFATAMRGQVVVIGVVTRDTRAAAAAAARDAGASFPAVFDPDGIFLARMGRTAIPVTFFVDEYGRVLHADVSGALTRSRLIELSRTHLRMAP